MVSSKSLGDLKGALAFISITCSWISFPKVNCGNSTKLTTLPWKSFMTLSVIGRACNSSLTKENSCSGPKTSSGLYVAFPLFYVVICSECVYSLRLILNMTVVFLTFYRRVFNRSYCLLAKNQSDFMKTAKLNRLEMPIYRGSWIQIPPPALEFAADFYILGFRHSNYQIFRLQESSSNSTLKFNLFIEGV
jgi:hypothetical protein